MSNLVVQTNVLALNSHRNLKVVGDKQSKASQKLSSGYRINSAADDAAGLAISEKMRAQIRGLDMASKNAQDAGSLIQTAEGGMQEIDNMVQRIRELVVYASNDTQEHNSAGTGDRQKIQEEIDALVKEIDSMSERVEFNKKKVLNGDCAAILTDSTIASALEASEATLDAAQSTYNTSVTAYNTSKNGITSNKNSVNSLLGDADMLSAINVLGSSTSNSGGAATLITTLNSALDDLNDVTGALATADSSTDVQDVLDGEWGAVAAAADALTAEVTTVNGYTADEVTAAATVVNMLGAGKSVEDVITGLKTAYTTSETAATTMATNGGALAVAKGDYALKKAAYDGAEKQEGLYFQLGANATQGLSMSINTVNSDKLGIGDGNGVSNISVLKATGEDINGILDKMDKALSYVTTERAKLGAAQNRLDYTKSSLDISSENLSAAESRIRDTDMAKEMMKMTAANVLQQAGVSMLTQANQAPQSVLQLLG